VASWLAFSLLAVVLWGGWGFLSKVAARELPSQAVYLLAGCGHGAVIGYLWLSGGLAVSGNSWGLAAGLAAGLCLACGLLFFLKGLAVGTATVVVPLTALYPLVTVILSWALLRENLTPRHLAGIVLALTAGWLLAD
jgi:transporter family protein